MINSEQLTHNLCTHGFHVIDDFLALDHCRALRRLSNEMHHQGLFNNAKIGPTIQAQQNNTIRTDTICWLEEDSTDPAVQAYLKATINLALALNRTLFLSLAEFETHFAVYQPGTFYKKHIDQFATKKTRKVSCVYYLNEHWQADFGGELKLYNQADQLIETIQPIENRFICFNSELPHEVCVTHHPRYSIAGWMKTRAAQTITT